MNLLTNNGNGQMLSSKSEHKTGNAPHTTQEKVFAVHPNEEPPLDGEIVSVTTKSGLLAPAPTDCQPVIANAVIGNGFQTYLITGQPIIPYPLVNAQLLVQHGDDLTPPIQARKVTQPSTTVVDVQVDNPNASNSLSKVYAHQKTSGKRKMYDMELTTDDPDMNKRILAAKNAKKSRDNIKKNTLKLESQESKKDAVIEEQERKIAIAELSHQQEVEDLKRSHQKEVEALKEKMVNTEKENENLKKMVDAELCQKQEVEDLKRGYQEDMEDLKRSHQEDMENLKMGHQEGMENLKRSHQEDMENLKMGHQEGMEDLKRCYQKEAEDFKQDITLLKEQNALLSQDFEDILLRFINVDFPDNIPVDEFELLDQN